MTRGAGRPQPNTISAAGRHQPELLDSTAITFGRQWTKGPIPGSALDLPPFRWTSEIKGAWPLWGATTLQ